MWIENDYIIRFLNLNYAILYCKKTDRNTLINNKKKL